uniref:Uncharacterized protein n=1 Tax=Panagrolaimus sp. ES5 TaxID=591445 RepID=A0AC34GZ18_9BILA
MKQKIFKYPTHRQLRKKSESSQSSSSQEETLLATAVPVDTCHKCKVAFATDAQRSKGVAMVCTFDACPYNHRPIHRTCFDDLEKDNYHYLKHCGKKTAKWTENKIWKCMWKRAGLRLLKRQLRCPCMHGYFCRDADAYYEMKKVEEEDRYGYISDSEEIIDDEPFKFEDIRSTMEDNKKHLQQQVFDPFEHESRLVNLAASGDNGSVDPVDGDNIGGGTVKNILTMFS